MGVSILASQELKGVTNNIEDIRVTIAKQYQIKGGYMDITRRMVENKESCERLVELKLDDMGVDSEMAMDDIGIDDKGEIRAATKKYCIETLQEYLNCTDAGNLIEEFDSLGMEVWAFVAGYEACLKKQLAPQTA